ncbi:Abi family protein [Lactobacillus crispatus]|uniref:Abi family protein n=1 Tax=Lactobacillus crispatus TaxID=47770 RepID=UPI0018AACF51|nr:Abi family protein [Lactobacillus crispatus]
MKNPHHLTLIEQRRLLWQRGIQFSKNNLQKDELKLKEVGYYKIKEFAQIYAFKSQNSSPHYNNVRFSDILTRYYQDKNLRMYLFHAMESIEVFLNNQIAESLGQYGPFGYLTFNNWVDRNIGKNKVIKKESRFKQNLGKKIKHSNLPDIRLKDNINSEGLPTVWVMVDCLSFGNSVHIVQDMSPKNKRKIAAAFNCTPSELVSWLKCINFIRNTCAHNDDLIDLAIKTKPLPPSNYKQFLFKTENKYTNKAGIAIFIIKQMMDTINPLYKFDEIVHPLQKICNKNESLAYQLGFKNYQSIYILKKRM